ncbi:hypothetical protein BYT27DRAFT_7264249 [Phlegmacium glaucopus]|nr:hypothetical protein BYT27DRAFT_7264249 [Phlegmacium glaucopus]
MIDYEDEASSEDLATNEMVVDQQGLEVTEDDIEIMYESRGAMRERLYAQLAMTTAIDCRVFSEVKSDTVFFLHAERAAREDLKTFQAWGEQLKAVTRREAVEGGQGLFVNGKEGVQTAVVVDEGGIDERRIEDERKRKRGCSGQKSRVLNNDQQRAHDIIKNQLLKRLAGGEPPQLKMLVLGHGGTGKSMLIGAITETFKELDCEEKLAKCATSGVAAVIIGGQMYHAWAGIPINKPRKNDWVDTTNQAI